MCYNIFVLIALWRHCSELRSLERKFFIHTLSPMVCSYESHDARSAGTENNARVKVTPGLLGWADIIFCMEKKHVRRIKERYSDIIADKTVICLNIPDDYNYMDDDLCELLNAIIPEYL